MRLASLYSGGKDSSFSLYLAEQQGHEVPYLVNIVPEGRASWLFHTPNLGAVPAMAEAMGKELVVGRSTGEEGSDTEGLRGALEGLDVDGVVSGVSWSDYQWDRMNAVCGSLGLRFFAPMWRKDQDLLMETMLESGVEAVIVGCFAEGFDESWLGRPIDAGCVEDLRRLRSEYGVSIMGEGGEYESMTLHSPSFRHRLRMGPAERMWKRNSGTLEVSSLAPQADRPSDSGRAPGLNLPSLSALATTDMEEHDIAAAASIGRSSMTIPKRMSRDPAATGMHIAL